MQFGAILFLAGILLTTHLPILPSILFFCALLLLGGIIALLPSTSLKKINVYLFIFIFGFCYSGLRAHEQLKDSFPKVLEGKTLLVKGVIASIPEQKQKNVVFNFKIKKIAEQKTNYSVRISWFDEHKLLKVGDQWQLLIRAKKPHGFADPGSFDYEAWMFEHSLSATGYVVDSQQNIKLASHWYVHPIDRVREKINNFIITRCADFPFIGIIKALIIGVTDGIDQSQWQVFRATGTNHLVAIAGLHIGIIAALAYLIINFLWRRSARLTLMYPAPLASAVASLIAAFIYSALAGFAIPTQRAVVMIAAFLYAQLRLRHLSHWSGYCLALWAVLIFDPFSVLAAGFWLSFAAVGLIIYGVSQRVNPHSLWWKLGRIQWVIGLGLIPFTLWLFQQASMVSLIANMIAVPWVELLIVPIALCGGLLSLVNHFLSALILKIACYGFAGLWWILHWLANQPHAFLQFDIPNNFILISLIIGMLILVMPRGMPGRFFGIIFLSPLFFYIAPKPEIGQVWVNILDVGQGLATVVQTTHHTLIYDTGPKLSPTLDTGESVVIPFLNHQHIKHVDVMMISHGDNDHIGGSFAILKQIPVNAIYTSVPERFAPNWQAQYCVAGQHWNWDDVNFDVLYPPTNLPYEDNNSSCVLKITTENRSILFTGDIQKPAEQYLLQHDLNFLAATVLVVPHHGSRTSSTPTFVNAIHPQYALFSYGYRNRYRLPSKNVVQRYDQNHVIMLNTVDSGAIQFILYPTNLQIHFEEFRKKHQRFWNIYINS